MASLPLTAGDPERVGPYRLLARLGQGGMGRVYLGRSPGGHAVAVKVVREALLRDEASRRRFVREVEAAQRVTGFFTAGVVDADPAGNPAWLATEYVPGLSLQEAVALHGVWGEQAVRGLGAALAEALAAVHAEDLVHRDLKPSNVLLAPDGPRVIDFGISAAADDTALTETGMVIGTPGFIPPEQLRHERSGPAGDVFALGAVLAHAATGAGPFGGGAAHAVNYRVVHQDPDLRALPPALAGVVARCLAKDPGERPTVAWLLEALGRPDPAAGEGAFGAAGWLPGPVADSAARMQAEVPTEPVARTEVPTEPVALAGDGTPEPPDTAEPVPPRPGRRRLRTGLAAATALAVVVTGAVVWQLAGDDDAPAADPPNVERLWSRPLDEGQIMAAATDRTVYLQNEDGHEITALSGADGSERWARRVKVSDISGESDYVKDVVGEGIEVTAVSGGLLYYGSGQYLYALDADDGEPRWKYMDRSFHSSPITVGDAAYAHMVAFFYVLDARTGEELWGYPFGSEASHNLAVTNDAVLVHNGKKLIAVDSGTHKPRWTHLAESDAETALVMANGNAYFGTQDGALYAVDAATGDEVWRRTFEGDLWDGRLGGGAGAPEVVDGIVYFENDGYVSAFDADSGRPLWRWRTSQDAKEVTAISVVDGTVFVCGSDGYLSALDARTGKLRYREFLVVDEVDFRFIGNILYVERDGQVTAYRAAT
ncbi:serine/threonine-protein kinase [Streptomyces sp. NBC_00059]|uniref:serine/threonine-protein kinase n=1 Tax=Streptomyces sp. NBC_00059 TaxID=2975635 RepID=UPI00224E0369|nr:serine/threonine-protein kinase [Streptomyces sp. NBC_00059]MCX5410826.1 serine/threonine-protein kinase [Streptomyces sp. NBC_00059]